MREVNKNINISAVRQKIYIINRKRTRYVFSLVHGKPMVHGLAHEVYRRCGKKNCRCVKGERHGPYPALSVNKDGKQRIVMIKKADVLGILKEANRYRYYQETLAKIRRINKEVDELLERVKTSSTRAYP